MNTVEQFAKEVAQEIKKYLPEEYRDIECEAEKKLHNNGIYMNGVTFKNDRGSISPTIFMEYYFDIYNSTGSMDKVMEKIASLATEYLEVDSRGFDDITDFEAIKDSLSPMLINTRENLAMLQELPHMRIEDLSLICRIDVRVADEVGGVNVTEAHLKEWGIGKEQLFKQLSENMQKQGDYILQDVGSYAEQIIGFGVSDRNLLKVPDDYFTGRDEQRASGQGDMYVLSNRGNVRGAAAIVCPGVMEKVSRLFPEGFYILPSSIHECMVLPKNDRVSLVNLKDLVRDVNRTKVKKEEILSDNVYEYDRERGKVRLASDSLEKEKGMER